MKRYSLHAKTLLPFAAILIAFVFLLQPGKTSAQTSSSSDSKLVTVKQETLDLASKALDELEVQDKLVASQERELSLISDRLEAEKQKTTLLAELAASRTKEAESYKAAADSAKEAIAAKDQIIANKDKEVELLKKKKPSVLSIVRNVMIGVGIGMVLK